MASFPCFALRESTGVRRWLVATALCLCLGCTGLADDRLHPYDYFDTMVDRHLEAGWEDPVLRTDDALLAQRKIVSTAGINERTAKDLIARILYLDAIDGEAPIEVFLATQGGWTDSMFAVIDAMEMATAPVAVTGIGGIYSAGAGILCSATGRRAATENSIVMVHANESDSEERPSELSRGRYEALWRRCARLPEEWFPMTEDVSHYMSPAEALEYGLIDEILPARKPSTRVGE
ncbi:MAG: ATP-dependent Clp protease proteolytic subunit [Myxococcota bacterium]|nr:ATP-dependent Clp protease proteolytic subunit [Myxococcota bacterium]